MTEKLKTTAENGKATELETFLPKDNSATNGVTKYKITKGDDYESGINDDFDPFITRSQLPHPVSDLDTLTHLLKAALGTGILSMPAAFKASGLALGIVSTILVSIICTHCAYILVVSAHELYKRCKKTEMSYAEVALEACLAGPKWARHFAHPARLTVLIGIFVTYFATCSCYTVIIAKNINYVVGHYLKNHSVALNSTHVVGNVSAPNSTHSVTITVHNPLDAPEVPENEGEMDIRLTIGLLLVPLILLAYVPNLKYLAPVSMVANGCMAIGLGITFYYLVSDMPSPSERPMVGSISTFPVFFSITIFALEAIGVVMPLENHMKTPQHFTGLCGVLNQGMAGVTLVYMMLGFFGYLKFGEATEGSITLNLPQDEIAAQVVNILIAVAVFCTFGLQFYVCLDIAWNGCKERFTKHPMIAQYVLRTFMVTLAVGIAAAVPTIVPFVSLIGAFCFSILGLMVPVGIEILTFWDKGFGPGNWKIYKDVVVIVTGTLALIFGSKSAIEDIVAMYVE